VRMYAMSYKSYVWPFNPENVEIAYTRNIKNLTLPLYGSVLQDLGCDKRVVTGSGSFTGEECTAEFNRLAAVFRTEGSGILRLPGISPFTAAFSSLKMVGEAQPDFVSYSFEFIEDENTVFAEREIHEETYLCKGGESLWSVANLYHTTADRLKALNPMIQWPNDLKQGQRVVLP
jgi:hypothetical protein